MTYMPQPTTSNSTPASREWNAMAVLSLCFVPFLAVVSIITGHIGLAQIRRTGQRGHSLALLGVVLGYLGVVAVAVLTVALIGLWSIGSSLDSHKTATSSDSPAADPGEDSSANNLSVSDAGLQVGECFDHGDMASHGFSCSESHDNEVFYTQIAPVAADGYPGDDEVGRYANAICGMAFEAFTGSDVYATRLDYSFYYPSRIGWKSGDREVICFVFDTKGSVSGSLKGKGPENLVEPGADGADQIPTT